MSIERIPGSFRDPSGFLFRHEGVVYRQVNPGFRESYDLMLSSGFYGRAVERGLLLAHKEVPVADFPTGVPAYQVIRPEQLPFISYPYEWSFSQLKDAALLTLKLQKTALADGLWLKDASAYNVQFNGGRPVFIDTLSFEAYPEGRPWVAYQQFCRHFLAPLLLMRHRHVGLSKLMRAYIDGIPLDVASVLLPLRTRFALAPLMHVHLHARSIRAHAGRTDSAARARTRAVGRTALLGLVDSLEGAVRRLEWEPSGTEWGDYYDATNYSQEGQAHKAEQIAAFVEDVQPTRVWDLGANTGRFSRIASDRGIFTVAFDVDPAAVDQNYREVRKRGEPNLLPLVMDLTNPSPDLGWNGNERASLRSRGPADLTLALALVHHLAISNNVPLDRVAEFLATLSDQLVIEFVPKEDSQVQRLLASRPDIFPDYTQSGFERAFERFFRRVKVTPIRETSRVLYLFARREPR